MTLPATILEAAKTDFDRDGYSIIRSFLSSDDVQQIDDQLQYYIREELPQQLPESAFYEVKGQPETLFRLNALHERSSYFAHFSQQEQFTKLAETLLESAAVSKSVQMFGKAPIIGSETPAHQDSYYFHIDPIEALTMWLPLDCTDEGNGCIRYLPGSHKRGLLPHGRGETFGFSMGLSDLSDQDRDAEVAVSAEPGDLIVHDSLLIHRADPNPSDRRRWALGLVYFSSRAKVDQAAMDTRNRAVHTDWKATDKT